MRRHLRFLLVSILCVLVLAGCSNKTSSATVNLTSLKAEFDEDDYYNGEIPKDATAITLNKSTIKLDGSGATIKGSIITISSKGVYVIKGSLDDGQIVVNAGDKDDVWLILNGVAISSKTSSPIYIQNADKVVISLQKGTVNTLSDTKNYALKNKESDEPNATLYSKSDLVINGTGTLNVNANYNNAINSRDYLKITEATIKITSVDDGIIGHDLLATRNAKITLTTDGDGLKSTIIEDSAKGFIDISGGSINITSGSDAIQAMTTIHIADAEMNLTTGGGSNNASSQEATSSKAIKANKAITITNGIYTIDSYDDSIHSNTSITISGGTYDLSSGDDGIHADSQLDIKGGTININKCYEGLESSLINITDGTIQIAASDDGVNISSNTDSSTDNNGPGREDFNAISGDSLNVNGGYLYVNAGGDGLDSNNSINISGGTVIVNGPTNDGNGALDYNGTFNITGGYLIAAGSSGMAQGPSDTSSQYSVGVVFTETQKENTLVHIEDSKGDTIATFAPAKSFASIIVSSPDIKKGETYTVSYGGTSTGKSVNGYYSDGTYTGGTELDKVQISSPVAWIGTPRRMGGFGDKSGRPMGGGPGRGMGGPR